MPESNAFPHHRTGIGRQSPSVIAGNFWDGSTVLLLVGIQHKVAPGRSEYVLSGMSISVVKNGGVLYTAGPSLMSTKFPATVASIRVRLRQPVTI